MIAYIYTGNHPRLDGIRDYLSLFQDVLGSRGFEVRITGELVPGALNLIIEEFSSYIEHEKLAIIKKTHPDTRLVFVLTEFVSRRWGVTSFNHFEGLGRSCWLALFNVFIRRARPDFPDPTLPDYLKAAVGAVVLVAAEWRLVARYAVKHLIGSDARRILRHLMERNHRLFYNHMRFVALMSNSRHADAIITSHEGISTRLPGDPKFLGVVYPELDERAVLGNLMRGKALHIEITGSVTSYRQEWVERINKQLLVLGIHHRFQMCQAYSFATQPHDATRLRGAYSLHPPQSPAWPFSSPTRIYRALVVDHNLPVLTHYFGQNPIEDLCQVLKGTEALPELYDMYMDQERLKTDLRQKIRAYNAIACARNDALADGLRSLGAA